MSTSTSPVSDSQEPLGDEIHAHVKGIQHMIAKYSVPSVPLPRQRRRDATRPPQSLIGKTILLTGSTGTLGAYLLGNLVKDSGVGRIYAVNRPSVAKGKSVIERHQQKFQEQGLDMDLLGDEKVTFLECDLSTMDISDLEESLETKISVQVDVVIHLAWKMGFRAPVEAYEPNFRSMRNLIDLAQYSLLFSNDEANVKFIFCSSVGSAQSWDRSLGPYPERVVLDAKYAVGMGYGESKYVAERILTSSALNATSLRGHQFFGATQNGAWVVKEWFPSCVKSSVSMGVLPESRKNLSWIPMDAAAEILAELIHHEGRYPPVMNLSHPRPVDLKTVMSYVNLALQQTKVVNGPMESLPSHLWIQSAVGIGKTSTIPATQWPPFLNGLFLGNTSWLPVNPVADSTEFGLPAYSIAKMLSHSKTLQNLKPLSFVDVEKYINYWINAGLFGDSGSVTVLSKKSLSTHSPPLQYRSKL